jgi:hypothetical protein
VQLTTGTLGPALRYWLGVGSENKSKSEKGAAAGADGLTWQWEPREATGGEEVQNGRPAGKRVGGRAVARARRPEEHLGLSSPSRPDTHCHSWSLGVG